MNLYLVSQDDNSGYDTFDSIIVAAESEEQARRTYPNNTRVWDEEKECWLCTYDLTRDRSDTWSNYLSSIDVELIGEAKPGTKAGLILASFNAG